MYNGATNIYQVDFEVDCQRYTLMYKLIRLSREFVTPILVFLGIIGFLLLDFFSLKEASTILITAAILIGSYQLFKKTVEKVFRQQFALDYIAILAISVAFFTHEYLVAAILALMIASGRNLEEYAISRAKQSLRQLSERIPDTVILWQSHKPAGRDRIANIKIGQEIFIRKGEVIPLDGILLSKATAIDESTLTGEAQWADKIDGDQLFSGTVNMGGPIAVKVSKEEKNSTYNKILQLVADTQNEKTPLIRLADKYSNFFTVVTLSIAGFSFIFSGFSLDRVLAVLAIATPCPLIIATPVALLGGVNAASKKRVIVKRFVALEVLSRITALVFDKTGTITIGKPKIEKVEILSKDYSQKEVLSIAEAIERNSLHPFAKAVVDFAKKEQAALIHADNIEENIGFGISGVINNKKYLLSKMKDQGMAIELTSRGKTLAVFQFKDEIKQQSKETIKFFKNLGCKLFIFTGDKKAVAARLVKELGENVEVRAELTPADKLSGVKKIKQDGFVTAMIGDGINDAPALALADVGLVFSNEEQTAASEAADVIFLGGEFSAVADAYKIAKRTIQIAWQSIIAGMGLSTAGMVFAAAGLIPPILGAGIQEFIDVVVILNAIRASR